MALAVIVLAGLYLIGLGAASLLTPSRATRFLRGVVSSVRAHYLELLLRFVIGAALVLHAPRMSFPGAFNLVGWVLLVTAACLLPVPRCRHQPFAQHTVPSATRYNQRPSPTIPGRRGTKPQANRKPASPLASCGPPIHSSRRPRRGLTQGAKRHVRLPC
jgi:hypothetical protein